MRSKTGIWLAVMSLAFGLETARGQNPPPPTREGLSGAPTAIVGGPPAQPVPEMGTLSEWITYNQGGGAMVGAGIPVMNELFLRSGLVVPTSAGNAGNLGRLLSVGWDIEGGGKILFFNQAVDRAWTISASLSNVANNAFDQHTKYKITSFFPTGLINPATNQPITALQTKDVTVHHLNRTYVTLAAGREWYLFGSANSPGNRWRVGTDVGGRWGSARIDLNEIHHRTDVIGAVVTGYYSDLAIPAGACTFLGGVRAEIDYTWSDILQGSNDVMSVNVLFCAGVLF